jgi:hypothetical protein
VHSVCRMDSALLRAGAGGCNLSRWQRDKSKMGSLEEQVQLALAANFERENQALRLKMIAMERALAARDA